MQTLAPFVRVWAGLMLIGISLSGQAQPDLTFINGGYPDMCSDAARSVDLPGGIAITGSRLDISPIEICTRAIQTAAITQAELAASYNNRGVLYFHEKLYPQALQDFAQAALTLPTLAAAYINRGYTLVALQRWPESLLEFDRGIALGPPDAAKAYYSRGVAHEEVGQLREAYHDYLQAAALAPDWSEPQQELSRFKVSH